MKDNQLELLNELIKRLMKEERTPEKSLKSLQSAGILDKNGEISNNYPYLKEAMSKNK